MQPSHLAPKVLLKAHQAARWSTSHQMEFHLSSLWFNKNFDLKVMQEKKQNKQPLLLYYEGAERDSYMSS